MPLPALQGGVVQQHHVLAEEVVEVRAGSCTWHLHPVTCHCCWRLNVLEVVGAAARAAYVAKSQVTHVPARSLARAGAIFYRSRARPARAEHAAGQKSGCTWRPEPLRPCRGGRPGRQGGARAAYVAKSQVTHVPARSLARAGAIFYRSRARPARAEHAAGQKSGCTWRPEPLRPCRGGRPGQGGDRISFFLATLPSEC